MAVAKLGPLAAPVLQRLARRGSQQLTQALAGFKAGAAEAKQVVQRVVASVRDFLGGEDHRALPVTTMPPL